MFNEKRTFKNSKGLKLAAIYEGEEKDSPVVIICHGFASSKVTPSIINLAEKLVEGGLCVYRFDFSGSGESEGKTSDRTPLQGIDDLKAAVKDLGRESFALYGSSFGGWVSIAYASESSVLALGLKCPVSSWKEKDMPRKKNDEKVNIIPGQDEVGNYNLFNKAKKILAPTLIVHGSDDETVPLAQSERLLKSLGGESRLSIIHNAPHTMRGAAMEDANTQLTEFFINKLL